MVKGKFRKSPTRYTNGHYSRGSYSKEQFVLSADGGDLGGLDRHALYESAVQSPKGDISYLIALYQQYVGPQVPQHLREDFCGTALISATWCRGDVRRTATGLDIDREALLWGLRHNGEGLTAGPAPRLCLLQCDVRAPVESAQHVALPPPAHADVSAAAAADAGHAAGEVAALRLEDSEGGARQRMHADASAAAGPACGNAEASTGPFLASSSSSKEDQQQQDRQANGQHPAEPSRGEGHAGAGPLAERQHGEDTSLGSEEGAAEQEDLRGKAADIVCAFNFSVCLLHERPEVQLYFRNVREALSAGGGVFVMDLLGGHEAEGSAYIPRHNEVTGASFVWEQEAFDPVSRHIRCYITLRDPATRKMLRRAFCYNWRLWTIPELREMLLAAGFHDVRAWLRPMKEGVDDDVEHEGQGSSSGSSSAEEGGGQQQQADFVEHAPGALSVADLQLLAHGWTAFIVGIVRPAD